jgi:hypothetical protein
VDFIFAEPWATRVRQDGTDRDAAKAANDGVQYFFRKVGSFGALHMAIGLD